MGPLRVTIHKDLLGGCSKVGVVGVWREYEGL